MRGRERFEAWLEPSHAALARAWLVLGGYSSKADFVRDCVLGNFAGQARLLESRLGALALALNDLVLALEAGPVSGEPEIRALVTRCDRLHRKAARELARERRK